MNDTWLSIKEQRPPENVVIMTRIDDDKGIRNETSLLFTRNLFWAPDQSIYVYYNPTHWRHLNDVEKSHERTELEKKAAGKDFEANKIRETIGRI